MRCDVSGTTVVLADDDVLHRVDQTAGQVPCLRGLERRVGLSLAASVRGDEVLQDGESALQVALDGQLDGATGGVGNQSLHAAQLRHLAPVSAGAGRDHVGDIVLRHLEEAAHHGVGHLVLRLGPDTDGVAVALVGGDESLPVEVVHLANLLVRLRHHCVILRRHDDVAGSHRDTRERREAEADVLDPVGKAHRRLLSPAQFQRAGDEVAEPLLGERVGDVSQLPAA
jgi:hypothetical protein